MIIASRRIGRRLGAALALITMLALELHAPTRVGAIVGCRSDPQFSIAPASGGPVRLQVAAQPDLDSGKVIGITYEVHAPASAALTGVLYTGGPLAGKETFTFSADQAPGTYVVITTVQTRGADAAVTVSETLVSEHAGSAIPTFQTPGLTDQGITTTVSIGS